jgi:predicted metal-binding membrane protein
VNALAARSRTPILLVAGAAAAWAVSVERMRGMDAGPGTDLGGLGWYLGIWVTMTAAMMLPSAVPAAGHVARLARRNLTVLFVAGYLAVWTGAGVVAYLVFEPLRALDAPFLAWDRAGRYVAAAVVLVAAAYQLTAAKAGCLRRCRAPLVGEGSLRGGLRHGASCVACCAGLTAALFALGVMSLNWMLVIAALIAAERLLPWRTRAVYGVAAALAVLGIWMAAAPGDLPGLTVPGAMQTM